MSADRLNIDLINSKGQLFVDLGGNWWWPVFDIDVQTGLFRIDVCGLLECHEWCEALQFRDESRELFWPEMFEMPTTTTTEKETP